MENELKEAYDKGWMNGYGDCGMNMYVPDTPEWEAYYDGFDKGYADMEADKKFNETI